MVDVPGKRTKLSRESCCSGVNLLNKQKLIWAAVNFFTLLDVPSSIDLLPSWISFARLIFYKIDHWAARKDISWWVLINFSGFNPKLQEKKVLDKLMNEPADWNQEWLNNYKTRKAKKTHSTEFWSMFLWWFWRECVFLGGGIFC